MLLLLLAGGIAKGAAAPVTPDTGGAGRPKRRIRVNLERVADRKRVPTPRKRVPILAGADVVGEPMLAAAHLPPVEVFAPPDRRFLDDQEVMAYIAWRAKQGD